MTAERHSGMPEAAEPNPAPAAVLIDGATPLRVWGEPPCERLRRGFRRHGYDQFVDEAALASLTGDVVLVRGDVVLDAPVIAALADLHDTVLLSSDSEHPQPLAALVSANIAAPVLAALRSLRRAELPQTVTVATVDDLGATYWQALRKRETPYALRLTRERVRRIEWRMFLGTYKGATDFVTKWLWPRPAFHATKLCVRLGLTPNIVTAVSLAAAIAVVWWFMNGAWWPGLIAAWAMTFLDTVDGKLARITQTSSRIGNVFDHSIDLIHPPFWYAAWVLGLIATGAASPGPGLTATLTVIIGGYLVQRALEGAAIWLFKIEIHIWRRIDTAFRQITARRNPNLVLLTLSAIVGRPEWGLVAVAWWTAICLALHVVQFIQASVVRRRNGRLSSWLTTPATP